MPGTIPSFMAGSQIRPGFPHIAALLMAGLAVGGVPAHGAAAPVSEEGGFVLPGSSGSSVSSSANVPPAGSAPAIDELLRRLDALEDRNRELEQRVSELNAQQGETWVGEQRAAQIRQIVTDVLADSQTRMNLQDSGVTAGWNDGFFLASSDGRFLLKIGGFAQTRFTYSHIRAGSFNFFGGQRQFVFDRREDRWGFSLPEVQLWANGHLFSRDFQYMIKARFFQQVAAQLTRAPGNAAAGGTNFSGFELLDAWLRVNLDDNWSVRAGQYRSPYSRGFLVEEQYLMSAARSVVDYHYALGYTQGIDLMYENDEFRVHLGTDNGGLDNLMGDSDAAMGGAGFKIYPTGSLGPANAPWWMQNVEYSVTSRLEWKPAGSWKQFRSYTSPMGETFGLLLGLGAHYQASRPFQSDANTPGQPKIGESQWLAMTVDGQANFGGASLYGAFFWNYVDAPAAFPPPFGSITPGGVADLGSINFLAFQLQGAVYVAPKWEVFGRYEFAWLTGQNETVVQGVNPALLDPDPMNLLTIGVNYYIDGQDIKWTTDLGWAITAMHPWFADMQAGYRPSRSDEVVIRTQLQLMF